MIPLERTHEYRGRYHVLGGALSPIDGVDPDDLRIAELYRRVLEAPDSQIREVVLATNPTTTGEATALHIAEACASARRELDRDAPRERPAGRRRPRVRRRGHARPRVLAGGRARLAARAPTAYPPPADEHRRDEVRRHLGRRRRADQARGGADRRQARGGLPRRRGALRARQDDRRADRDGRGGLARARSARDGHAALDRRADLVRAVRDGDQRPRPRGAVADRLAGGDRHRHLAHQGAHPRRARRAHHRARSTRTRSCSSPASRASRPATT